MAGKWKSIDIAELAESPESHWMRTVMGIQGPQWCTIRLPRDTAGQLIKALARRYKVADTPEPDFLGEIGRSDDVDELVDKGARIAQSSFSALCRFWHDSREETVDTELLAVPDAMAALTALAASDGLEITDVSPAESDHGTVEGGLEFPMRTDGQETHGSDDGEVIVAIIDDGIGIANHRFRLSETRSRVEFFLDMNHPSCRKDRPVSATTAHCAEEQAVDINGRTWTKQDIDNLIEEYAGDENAIYRAMGMIDPRSDRRQPMKFHVTHGTHVLDLAAGFDHTDEAESAIARKRPIIAVQLPSKIVADRSDSEMPRALKAALQWIESAASELSEKAIASRRRSTYLPLVLNFSFGVFAGPHDGRGQVEQRISDFIRRYRNSRGAPQCEVVLPAGNGLQARAVAQFAAGASESATEMPWRVQPDDKTSSFMQIWLPKTPEREQQVTVSVTPPRDGPGEERESELDRGLDWVIGDTTFLRIYHQRIAQSDGEWRERITIAMRPTETDSGDGNRCPAGLWTVRVTNKRLSANAVIDLRIQRDDPVAYERPKGRQSYFDHPEYVRFEPDTGRLRNDETLDEGPVFRTGTLSAYATSADTVVVGGYRRSDGSPVVYSSSGPATSERPGPTVSAVSEESASVRGVMGSGTYTGSTAIMNGTSVAAPIFTRALADALAAGETLETVLDAVRRAEAAGIDGPQGRYPPARRARHGVGRLVTASNPACHAQIDG